MNIFRLFTFGFLRHGRRRGAGCLETIVQVLVKTHEMIETFVAVKHFTGQIDVSKFRVYAAVNDVTRNWLARLVPCVLVVLGIGRTVLVAVAFAGIFRLVIVVIVSR